MEEADSQETACRRQVAKDPKMQLTSAQKSRALAIKAAIEADNRLCPLTDFEYAQYALTQEEDDESLERICERAYIVAEFQKEYKLQGTAEEGLELLHQFTMQHPGVCLAVEYLPSSESYVSFWDYATFYPRNMKTLEHRRVFLGAAFFYMLTASQPDLKATKTGVTFMVECMDAGFDNFDPSLMERVMYEIYKAMPKNVKEAFFLNSPTVANMTYSIWKRHLPSSTRQAFHLGHQVEGMEGRKITELYTMPTPEAARQHMLSKFYSYLQLRYTNQQYFSLSDA